jgi:hypothetical protein
MTVFTDLARVLLPVAEPVLTVVAEALGAGLALRIGIEIVLRLSRRALRNGWA